MIIARRFIAGAEKGGSKESHRDARSLITNTLGAIIAEELFIRPYRTRVSAAHYTGNKLPAYYRISLTGFD